MVSLGYFKGCSWLERFVELYGPDDGPFITPACGPLEKFDYLPNLKGVSLTLFPRL